MPGDAYQTRLRRAVGDLLPAVGRIDALQRVEIGWGNENWTAEAAAGRVMVKVGLPDASADKWRCAAAALGLAREAGVPAPELLAFDAASAHLDGRVLRVFSYIEGFSPLNIIDDRAKYERFLGQLGDAIARLHGIARPEFSSRIGGGPGFGRWSEYLAHRWRAVVERATRAGLDPALVRAAHDALTPLMTQFDDVARAVLCHRDLYSDNLLCDREGNLVAVLDFDMAEAWEPAADFHKLRWWVFADDPEAERTFLHAYTARNPLPRDFDARVRLVEIVELVNGLANWIPQRASAAMIASADARLRALVGA